LYYNGVTYQSIPKEKKGGSDEPRVIVFVEQM
jgi:hypothetical protein